ncbi:MAG: hypothetical protein QXI71_01975 [Candidatus Bathyarchaeia archaeon]
MTRIFMMKLDKIQPSQLYISSEKLSEVMRKINFETPTSIEPLPIKRFGNEIVFVDGHTRAFAAFLCGFFEVPVYWEDEELDLDAYKICVKWCKKDGIRSIADLKGRVVPHGQYEKLWFKCCEKMQKTLKAERKRQ